VRLSCRGLAGVPEEIVAHLCAGFQRYGCASIRLAHRAKNEEAAPIPPPPISPPFCGAMSTSVAKTRRDDLDHPVDRRLKRMSEKLEHRCADAPCILPLLNDGPRARCHALGQCTVRLSLAHNTLSSACTDTIQCPRRRDPRYDPPLCMCLERFAYEDIGTGRCSPLEQGKKIALVLGPRPRSRYTTSPMCPTLPSGPKGTCRSLAAAMHFCSARAGHPAWKWQNPRCCALIIAAEPVNSLPKHGFANTYHFHKLELRDGDASNFPRRPPPRLYSGSIGGDLISSHRQQRCGRCATRTLCKFRHTIYTHAS